MSPPLQVGERNLPLVAEDGSETITQALVAGGVTGSSLDLEPAMTKILVKALLLFQLASVFGLNDIHCDTCV